MIPGGPLAPSPAAGLAHLSRRERELLALMAEGWSNAAIGEQLCLSPKTVECHVRSIFQKLGLVPDDEQHRRVLAVLAFLESRGRPALAA